MANGSTGGLTSLGVVIDIRDANGQPANSLFGIYPPKLTGLNAVDGTGTLSGLASGKAEWTPVEPAATAVSTGPPAPMAPAPATATEAAVALEEIDHEAVAALRRLRPAANQKAVWNKRAGRPDGRPDAKARYDTVVAYDDSPAERLITAQAPQRPLSTPIFQMEIDGQTVQGTEGQTILEVCRANGIEVPTL